MAPLAGPCDLLARDRFDLRRPRRRIGVLAMEVCLGPREIDLLWVNVRDQLNGIYRSLSENGLTSALNQPVSRSSTSCLPSGVSFLVVSISQ